METSLHQLGAAAKASQPAQSCRRAPAADSRENKLSLILIF
jgi:hypothetical protein